MRKTLLIVAVAMLVCVPLVGVAAADTTTTPTGENETTTPTPNASNATASNETTDGGGESLTVIGRMAELDVSQLPYVDAPVKRESGENTTTYITHGKYIDILPVNFDTADVADFGVDGDAALTLDRSTGVFTLRAQKSGTYTVWWQVAREGENGSFSRERYSARIQARNVDYAHVPKTKFEQIQEDAANWSEVVATFGDRGPDIPIEEKLSKSFNAWLWLVNPLSALQGDFVGALVILTMTNGGRLLAALLILVPAAAAAPHIIKSRRLKRRLPDVESLELEKQKQWAKQKKSTLWEQTPHDIEGIDERTADKLSEKVGENLWKISDTIHGLLGESTMKRIYLQAMAQHGYTATATTEPDGGQRVDIHAPDDDRPRTDGGASEVDLADPSDDVLEAVAWGEDIDMQALTDDVELSDLDAPISTGEQDQLLSELDIDVPEDFDTREQFADALWRAFSAALASDYTDDEGKIRQERSALNVLGLLTTVTHERYDVPSLRYYRDLFVYIANNVDSGDELQQAADESGYGDLGLDMDLDGDGGG